MYSVPFVLVAQTVSSTWVPTGSIVFTWLAVPIFFENISFESPWSPSTTCPAYLGLSEGTILFESGSDILSVVVAPAAAPGVASFAVALSASTEVKVAVLSAFITAWNSAAVVKFPLLSALGADAEIYILPFLNDILSVPPEGNFWPAAALKVICWTCFEATAKGVIIYMLEFPSSFTVAIKRLFAVSALRPSHFPAMLQLDICFPVASYSMTLLFNTPLLEAAPSEPTPFWFPTKILPPIVVISSGFDTDDATLVKTLVEKPFKTGSTFVCWVVA